jgi:hypothetical protein
VRPLWPALSERGPCAVEGVVRQHGPLLHVGAPFGCQGLLCLARLCGACLWGWDLVVSGVRPPHVWVPQCVAGVCAVLTLLTHYPIAHPIVGHFLPHRGCLVRWPHPLSPASGLSLSVSHTYPNPSHPMLSPWLCGACSGTSPALQKCRAPTTHTHTHPSPPSGLSRT